VCIIQDSAEDWIIESSKMAHIYKNSLLTIAAAAAPSGDDGGCFRTRVRKQIRPIDSGLGFEDKSSRYIFADRRATGDGARPACPIDERAWILQEQILSPRMLSYSHTELFWDCITHSASETFPDGIPGFYDSGMKTKDLRTLKAILSQAQEEGRDKDEVYSLWRSVVEMYSSRKMTKEADKLTALLGVAQEVASVLDDRLVAGLWHRVIWKDMLWSVRNPRTSYRPTDFSAPTWSWASVNAEISYELRGYDSDADLVKLVDIVSVEATTTSSASQTVLGEMVVSGALFPLSSFGPHQRGPGSRLSGVNSSSTRFIEDVELPEDPGKIVCLLVAASSAVIYALALAPLDELEEPYPSYERIGLVTLKGSPKRFGGSSWPELLRGWHEEEAIETIVID